MAFFSLGAKQIYWNKRKCSHKHIVELRQDWLGSATWLPFDGFCTPIWLPEGGGGNSLSYGLYRYVYTRRQDTFHAKHLMRLKFQIADLERET